MADLRISQLPELAQGDVALSDVVPLTDVSASETKKIKVQNLLVDGIKAVPDESIPIAKVDLTGGDLDGASLAPGSIQGGPGGQIADATIQANNMAPGSVVDAAIGSVGGAKITDGTVTDAKLAAGIDGAKISDGTITSAKFTGTFDGALIAAGSVGTSVLADGAVTTPKLADDAVTSAKVAAGLSGGKLSDDSVTSAKIASLDGAKLTTGSVTDNKVASGISGSKLATGSVPNTALAGGITGDQLAPATITSDKIQSVNGTTILEGTVAANRLNEATLNRSIDLDNSGNLGIANDIAAGTTSGITYNEQGLITAATGLVSTDLPIASDVDLGAVSVPSAGGLSVTGTGELSIDDVIVATSANGTTVNSKGQVTALRPIQASELPVATATTLGVSKYPASGALVVDASGSVSLSQTAAGTGPHVKVLCDQYGRVTDSLPLTNDDLPALDATKITVNQLTGSQLADDTITAKNLGDYTTCLMQEDFPGSSEDYFLGMMWFQPSTSQLRVYARGSAGTQWAPVGFGALQANNLRWGGTFDAAANTVSIVTEFGKTAGLEVGDTIPAPSDDLSGLYLICQTEGANVPEEAVSGVTFTPGDWLLCINEVQGYTHVDMGGAGGGGGGASSLNDLLDVTIGTATGGITLADKQLLEYDGGSGVWRNMAEIDGGSF